MKRVEVREFLKAGVDSLTPTVEFGSGRLSEFASNRAHRYPSVWQLLGKVSGDNPVNNAPLDRWDIELIIGAKDRVDSVASEYELIVDQCDEIAQKLIYKYNVLVEGYKLLQISNRERVPFVKDNSPDCISGVRLTFTLIDQDRTNLC